VIGVDAIERLVQLADQIEAERVETVGSVQGDHHYLGLGPLDPH